MGQLKQDRNIIYESPDGGKTVYGRYSGETDRWIVGKQYETSDLEALRDKDLWNDIRREAETNESLKKILDHAIMMYHLSKDYYGKE